MKLSKKIRKLLNEIPLTHTLLDIKQKQLELEQKRTRDTEQIKLDIQQLNQKLENFIQIWKINKKK